jgi:hypothetical protein
MIEDSNVNTDDRKNEILTRAGKPRPYLDIKVLRSDRDYKGLIYFCQGRGEASSPAFPISPSPHSTIFIKPLNPLKTSIHISRVNNKKQGVYHG